MFRKSTLCGGERRRESLSPYVGEIHKYELRLVEEWDLIFASMMDEIGESATAEVKERAARGVLSWAEQCIIPIRPRVTEPFVTRGLLHMLALSPYCSFRWS